MQFFIDLQYILLTTVFLPFFSGLFIYLCSKKLIRDIITITSSFLLLVLIICIHYLSSHYQNLSFTLLDFGKAHISFKIEPIGLTFSLIASLLWMLTSIYAVCYMQKNYSGGSNLFFCCFSIAIGCTISIAFAGDLLTIFVFYELLTISTYPLIVYNINNEAITSGRYYIGLLLGSSMILFFPGIVLLQNVTNSLDFTVGGLLQNNIVSPTFTVVLLFLLIYGIGKAALMPMHFWLPKAMVAPTPVSALLHAVAVVKSGVFIIIKIVFYIFGIENLQNFVKQSWFLGSWLTYVSGFTIIVASLIALKQNNLKKLLAYSTISQLSYIILSVSIFTHSAVKAAVFQLACHAFAKITLFFAAGSIATVSGKKYLHEMGGIGRSMPITTSAFTVGAFAMIGLPPTSAFWGKFFIIRSALAAGNFFTIVVLIISTLLNTAYFVPIIYNAFFIKSSDSFKEVPIPLLIPLIATSTLTLVIFFFPNLVLNLLNRL
ncbi:proton-conducting transporter membrane subunit [Candidatus Mesenet endosymbiont of Agriotes lineatus]|uniref:proton-conducting transporter transmembrane domain-containing protein n=1 Tax=Candidatus Mesenet endosymbiont of Agriotes lineatus TaxID=3077948 RepID=UPI0030D5B3B7